MKTNADPRHNARRVVLGSFFGTLFSPVNPGDASYFVSDSLELNESDTDFEMVGKLTEGIKKNAKAIDKVIEECAPEWPIEKISKVDLVALRIAVYELMFEKDISEKVVIDEAIELAKEFGGETSSKFVNGVLGTAVEIKEKMK